MNIISDRNYKESGMYAKEQAEVQTIPIQCKVALTIKEAAEYSTSGADTFIFTDTLPLILSLFSVG